MSVPPCSSTWPSVSSACRVAVVQLDLGQVGKRLLQHVRRTAGGEYLRGALASRPRRPIPAELDQRPADPHIGEGDPLVVAERYADAARVLQGVDGGLELAHGVEDSALQVERDREGLGIAVRIAPGDVLARQRE